MQKQWISSWALIALVTGCSMPGIPGAPPFAQRPSAPAAQMAAVPPGGPQQNLGFTERVVGYLTPGSPAGGTPQPQAATTNPAYQKLDPISLGFSSGPPSADLYLSMAQLSDRGGNTAHARSMYHKTLSIDSKNLEALLGLARMEDRQGQLDEAIRIYRQALASHPQDAKVLNDLALCHARKGELQLSASALEAAIKLQPKKQLYRNNIAKVLIEMNQINPALAHLSAVHSPAVAQYNIGVLLHQRGRNDEATHFLATAAQMDPQLVAANTILAQIKGSTNQVVQRTPATNDHILPTPMTRPDHSAGMPYPSTGVSPVSRVAVPAETARAPLSNSPILLPAVR
ncbi:MAG: tetratricopeptide repeat protein [Pirellulales bacterium]|nr:tetratricopeptide repeat protein [Pirellulales bacterium]